MVYYTLHIKDYAPLLIAIVEQSPEELEMRAQELADLEDLEAIPQEKDKLEIKDPKEVTFIDYDNPFELAEDASGIPHINELSRHAWVSCGADIYVLECMGKGYIRIEKTKSESNGQLSA